MRHKLLLLVFLCSLVGCRTTDVLIHPEFYKEDGSINVYAFIGQKISVEKIIRDPNKKEMFIGLDGDTVYQDVLYFDQGFTAKYKIISPVFNNLKQNTITFQAFDHYGRPKFENYEYVIMYLLKSEEDNKFYHYKYQFDPVKKDIHGNWTGLNGESVAELFEKRKTEYFKP